MSVQCLECGKEFKKQLTSHLRVHQMSKESYLQKHPGAKTIDESLVDKLRGRKAWNKGGKDSRVLKGEKHPMYGRKHSEESKKKNSESHSKLHREDERYKQRISEGTKKGMRKPESWRKFVRHVESRDYTGENNPFYGKTHTEETKAKIFTEERNKKISKKSRAWWGERRGKTVEELYGEERGKEIRDIKSRQTQGENNPAYGKVYEKSGSCKLGKYKGQIFRGILEYSYLKHLERLQKAYRYEPFSIPYSLDGVKRTYHPDFLVEDKIIEIKPAFHLSEKYFKKEVFVKKQAAEKYCKERGLTYEILTEKDFPVMTYAQAYTDSDVEWIRK